MPPTIDAQRVPRLLSYDATRTLGDHVLAHIASIATNVLSIVLEPSPHPDDPNGIGISEDQYSESVEAQHFFDQKVVDDFQQLVHDENLDTTWPACPRHPNHPLNYERAVDSWCCPLNGAAMARLGELHAVIRPFIVST